MKKSFLLLLFLVSQTLIFAQSSTAHRKVVGTLNGAQENPAVTTNAKGIFQGIFDPYSRVFAFYVSFSGLSSNVTAAHFHKGEEGTNGAAIINLVPLGFPTGVTSGDFTRVDTLTMGQAADLMANKLYINIHNASYPGGEIRAQILYDVPTTQNLTEAEVTPPTPPATGQRVIAYTPITPAFFPKPEPVEVTLNTANYAGKPVKIQLFNTSEQLLQDNYIASINKQYTLNIDGLDSGIYFVRLNSDGEKSMQKLTVQR